MEDRLGGRAERRTSLRQGGGKESQKRDWQIEEL
jgi:hypothetical protein